MFDDLIRSRFLGKPVRLYRFELLAGVTINPVWYFAQADRDVVAGGVTWRGASPNQIERDDIQRTSERAKDKLKIRLAYLRDPNAPALDIPATQSLGDLWHPYIPSGKVKVACLDWMYGDDAPPTLRWSGEVAQPQFTDVQLELTCMPHDAIGEAKGQGPFAQRPCTKVVFSTGLRGCNLDPAGFTLPGTATAVDGLTLTVPELAAAPLPLLQGSLSWHRMVTAHNGELEVIERRTILEHDGAAVRLLYGGIGLAAGLDVEALPDCPGTWADCDARGNTINFGGAFYKPVINPFDGQSMSWG